MKKMNKYIYINMSIYIYTYIILRRKLGGTHQVYHAVIA